MLIFLGVVVLTFQCDGLLYPQISESRETKSLNGIWNFRLSNSLDPDQGFREKW